MSWTAVDLVLEMARDWRLSDRELKVLLTLAKHGRKDEIPETAYVYVTTITREARISRPTCFRALADLQARGLLVRLRTGRASAYALTLTADLPSTPVDDTPVAALT